MKHSGADPHRDDVALRRRSMSSWSLVGAVVIRTGSGLASGPAGCATLPAYVGPRPQPPRSRPTHDVAYLTSPHPRTSRSTPMSNRTYRVTEIVGTSPDGIDQAVRNAVERAALTLRHVDWFEVTQVRGRSWTAPSSTSRWAQGRVPPRGRLTRVGRVGAAVRAGRAEGPRGAQPLLPSSGHRLHPRRDRTGPGSRGRRTPPRRAPRHQFAACRRTDERLPAAFAHPVGDPARPPHRCRVRHHPARRTRPSHVAARTHRGRLPLA